MGESMVTIDIYGFKFLRCAKDDCPWNVGYTPHDLNRFGLEFTHRDGVGIRVCNFGRKALAYGRDIDSDCPHKLELCRMLGDDDSSSESRFWGNIDPEVAKRALGLEPEQGDSVS